MRSQVGPVGIAVGMVVTNLVPLAGVVWFGWNFGTLLAVYWLEGVVVGVKSVLKVLRSEGQSDPADLVELKINGTHITEWIGKPNRDIAYHHAWTYGFSWTFLGIMVAFFAANASPIDVAVGLIGFVTYHVVSYWINFLGQEEYRRTGPLVHAIGPYRRQVIVVVTLWAGGWLSVFLGTATGFIILMVIAKTAFDLWAHLKEHDHLTASGTAGTTAD